MARNLPVGLREVLKSGYAESHSTLELSLPSDIAPAINHYFATARLTIDGVVYDRQLRNADAVKTSLTRAADRVTVELQNVDTILGVDLLAVADTLYGANVRFGRYWKDLNSKATFHHILLTGAVAGVEVNENVARLTLISDTYAAVSVGAKEQVIRTCRFQVQGEFRGTKCGYSGAKLTCDGLIDSADGCEGRHGTPLKRAKFGGFVYIEGANTIAGAAALPVPAYNQLMRLAASDGTVSATSKQQPFLALHEDTFNVANDNTNLQTRIAPKGTPTKLYNAVFDYNAVADGVTNTTTQVQAAIDAAELAGGGTVFLQAGTYKVTGLTINGNIKLAGSSDGEVVIYSTSNAPIIDCGQTSFLFPIVENLKIRGSVSAGSSQIGLRVDDATYGLRTTVRDVFIENCGGAGLYVGNAFSSHFENIYSSNCVGGNFVINSANMPVLTLHRCDSGTVHGSYRTGYHIKAGSVVMRDCNAIYGGSNPEWCVTVGKRIGRFGETAENGSAFVRFENCNFESSTVGGVELLYNSSASFHKCSWVGDGASSTTYKAVLADVCQYNPTETTGSITSGTNSLVVASAVTWTIGQGIKIAGAGVASADLSTTITGISGTTFTLTANASTTVAGAVVSHTDDIFYASTQARLGIIDDESIFSNTPASYYADSEPIHITCYPSNSGAATIPPIATNGRGCKIAGDKFVSNFRNDTTSKTWPLPRFDGFMPVQTITASTTYTGPGVRYIECDHAAPITITLPWPGWNLNSSNEFIVIKDISSAGAATNNITIQASSGGTVNGAGSYVISADKGAVILVPHSSDDYRVVSAYVPGSGISGSGSSTRLAYWSGASTLTSDSDLTYDGFNLTSGRVYHSGGSGGTPGIGPSADTGTGMYQATSGTYSVAVSAGATGERVRFQANGINLLNGRVTWDASETIFDLFGSGSPEGVVTASIGSVYRRSNGGTATTLYVKESGTGNTGWAAVGAGGGGSGTVNSGTANQLAYYASTGTTVSGLTSANSSVLATNGSGVPSWVTTLPSGLSAASISVTKLANLTSNGFVKTSSSDGTLSVDTATYLTGNQTITLSSEVTGSGATSITTTINKAITPTWTGLHTFNPGTTPTDALFLDIAALGSNGTRDSHSIVLRGRARNGSDNPVDWKIFNDVTTNTGFSQLTFSNRTNSGVYTDLFTFADDGTLSAIAFVGDGSGLSSLDATQLVNTVALANGGTGASLSSPGADRLLFWDDSAGQTTWLTLGTNLSITGTTINAAGGSGAALTKTDDTNVTLTLGGSPATALLNAASLTLGWTGTLAAGRLNANVVQAVTNDTNITGSISTQTLTLGWTGTLAASRLNSNVVQAITNDTNITGSISAQTLTLGWSGTLAKARQHAATVYTDAGNTWSTGAQSFASAASLTVPTAAGAAPTTSGQIAYDSTSNALEYGENGTNRTVCNLNGTQTLSNKTLTAPTIARLANLTTDGVITTTNSDGTLVVDDNALDYLYSLSCP